MKMKKTLGLALAATVLLAGCNKDGEQFEKYNDGLTKLQKAEAPIQQVNKEMNNLEKEKEKISKEVSGKDISTVQDKVKLFLDNAAKREAELKKEEDAMMKSKKAFETLQKSAAKVEDKEDKKELDEFNKALEDKYAKHEAFISGYKDVIAKEKDLFSYFQDASGNQEGVDEKSKALQTAQKEMNNKVKAYSKSIRKAQTERADVEPIINS
ncbi:YkyA family protein [Staphylococcus rostri]|uniref:EMYY motif lipoprotein n=1 Tax=Staphylococcus rostri TaxID=522262 RepID=A0A2K3YTL9_9STAP|nr:YkyA family protein [Staphylococcus rostri]PNZ28963.1 hypothetical protein CD122_03530 [Staphylococcus rostri]